MSIYIKSAIATLLLYSLFSCGASQDKENGSTAIESSKVQSVEVVNPKERSFTAEVLITGTAQPNQVVSVLAMESGVVTYIKRDIGDRVSRGASLATLENPEIDNLLNQIKANQIAKNAELMMAKADLEVAKTKASSLKSIADRLQSVYSKTPQLTNVVEVEIAVADSKAAGATVMSYEARLITKEAEVSSLQVQLASVEKRKSLLQIKAPFSGVITKRYVDRGALIQSGLSQKNPQAIVEIQEIDPIRLTLAVPESEAASIKKGMDVNVTFPEISGDSYQAKISRTSNALDPMSKTMQVEIDLKNTDGKILTGMYAKALVQVVSRESILSLPIMSKVIFKNESYVLVVESGVVKRLPIKIGLSDKDYFEVLNAEINANTQVIVQGKGLVKPSQIVEPQLTEE